MIRRKDAAIIAAALCLAVVLYGATRLARSAMAVSGRVTIFADGMVYADVGLNETRTVRVEQANGAVNVVSVKDGAVRMQSASCKNQHCVHQGEVTAENWTRRAMGRRILCLPNHVLVELALAQNRDAPDL